MSEIAVGLGKLFGTISPDPPRYPVAQIEPIVTYELPGSQLWAVLSPEKSRSPATASKVSKLRHNSRTKALNLKFINTNPSKYRYLLVLLVSTLSFQRVTRNACKRQTDRQTDGQTARLQ